MIEHTMSWVYLGLASVSVLCIHVLGLLMLSGYRHMITL